MPEALDHDHISYTERLRTTAWWKRVIGAQIPYQVHVSRIATGRVLDVGCGTGRNLAQLSPSSVGVDTNPHSIQVAVAAGLTAVTVDQFRSKGETEAFDTLLFAHILEHMTNKEAVSLVGEYLQYLVAGGRVVVIVPQTAGFASDSTHVEPVGLAELSAIAATNDLAVERIYSFPLPGATGRVFRYNETVAVMRKGHNRG